MIGTAMFWLGPIYRRRIRENLRQANIKDESLALKVSQNTATQALESIWVWYRNPEEVLTHVEITHDAQTLIDEAMKSGAPIVFMTPHLGCFEILPIWFSSRYWQTYKRGISILFRPPKKSFLRKLVGDIRNVEGIMACPTNVVGVKKVIKAIKVGYAFGALPDQVPAKGMGVWTSFFGKQAYTVTLPIKVASQFDARVFFATATKTIDGRWILNAEEWKENFSGDLEADAKTMNEKIEKLILKNPSQYAWSYNRYKKPARMK